MSEKTTKKSQKSRFIPQKNRYASRNCDNFVKKSPHVQFPAFLLELIKLGKLTHRENSACFMLYSHCYVENKPNFSLSLTELAQVMFCGRELAVSTIRTLESLNILVSGRSSANEKKSYRWNVELWTSHEPVVGLDVRGSRVRRTWQSVSTYAAVGLADYVYIQEYLLEYLLRISLRIVSDSLSEIVDNSGDNKGCLAAGSFEEAIALWERAIENVPPERRYLAILFFNDEQNNYSLVGDPLELFQRFYENSYADSIHAEHDYLFENQTEFFKLNKQYLLQELPEIGKGENNGNIAKVH